MKDLIIGIVCLLLIVAAIVGLGMGAVYLASVAWHGGAQ